MKAREQHYSQVDWAEVQDRLTLAGYRLLDAAYFSGRLLNGWGESPEDLVVDLLGILLDPDDSRLEWDPRRGKPDTAGVVALLGTALRRDIFDRKKSKRYKGTISLHDGSLDEEIEANPSGSKRDERQVEIDRIHRNEIIELLQLSFAEDPDSDVEDYLTLQIFDKEEYAAYTPQEVAERLDWTVQKVNNVKRRVERRLIQFKELLYAEKPGRETARSLKE